MSLLGSLNAATGGMNAQSAALSAISDNVANSQTVGFKSTETAFVNYLTESSATVHAAGAVVARPEYTNTQQGAVTQVSNPTALAVSGAGFFSVQRMAANGTGGTTFLPQAMYTRVGDFSPNSAGYLVNSTGYALSGWPATNTAGTKFDSTSAVPIQISKAPSAPVPTSQITLAANLPSSAAPATNYKSVMQVNDATGTSQNLTLSWTRATPATTTTGGTTTTTDGTAWALDVTMADGTAVGSYKVAFGDGIGAPAGTIASITPAGGTAASTGAATVSLAPNFGYGTQAIALNLGQFGKSGGVTQFAGSDYQVTSQSQDGAAQGNFSSVAIQAGGDVVINYDNGRTSTVARVPLVNFNNADALQQQDGQAFTATLDSGQPSTVTVGSGGTGKLVVGAEESSNVDIAAQFTQMIVAQRAYTANTKIISTANQMMQDTLNMVQG